MKSYGKISIIAAVAIGIAAMMIPGGSLVSRAFADGVSGGSANADFNTQINTAIHTADVHIHNHGGKISHSGNVDQSVSQSNSISANNIHSGLGGCSFLDPRC